jgi:hypothetical protein
LLPDERTKEARQQSFAASPDKWSFRTKLADI